MYSPDRIITGLNLKKSVIKNITTSCAKYEYVPTGYTCWFSCSSVIFLHFPRRNSVTKGSDGRISRNVPKRHRIRVTLSHACMLDYVMKSTKKKSREEFCGDNTTSCSCARQITCLPAMKLSARARVRTQICNIAHWRLKIRT